MAPVPCTGCVTKVTQASKALQCQFCDGWTHIRCIGISEGVYEQLVLLPCRNLTYTCDACLPKIDKLRSPIDWPPLTPRLVSKSDHCGSGELPGEETARKIQTRSESFKAGSSNERTRSSSQIRQTEKPNVLRGSQSKSANSSPQTHFTDSSSPKNKLGSDHKDLHGRGSVEDELSWVEVVRKSRPPISPKPTEERQTIQPMRESKYPREQCIIILKAPESQGETSEERMEDDRKFLVQCISKLFDVTEPGLHVVSAYRLGKKKEDVIANPRPLKVILESVAECERVFRRTYRLKGEPYYLLRDLCAEDRVKMKEAVEELKRRKQDGEKNLKIVDFQVVQRTVKARWKPVLLEPCHVLLVQNLQ
jgi:hypothetical protein